MMGHTTTSFTQDVDQGVVEELTKAAGAKLDKLLGDPSDLPVTTA
jgi:hypothetical protein